MLVDPASKTIRSNSSAAHLLSRQTTGSLQRHPSRKAAFKFSSFPFRARYRSFAAKLVNSLIEIVNLLEIIGSANAGLQRQHQRLSATEKAVDVLLEMQAASDQKLSNASKIRVHTPRGARENSHTGIRSVNRAQAQKTTLEENLAANRELKNTLVAIAESLDGFDQELTSVDNRTSEQFNRLESMRLPVARIEDQLNVAHQEQERAHLVIQKINRAIQQSPTIPHLKFTKELANAQIELRARKLFFSDQVVSDCLLALNSGRPLLLAGPPARERQTSPVPCLTYTLTATRKKS